MSQTCEPIPKGVLGHRRKGTSKDAAKRNPAHLAWVRTQPCCVFGCIYHQVVVEAHHIRSASDSGTGVKPPDDRVVPLCRIHHGWIHRHGMTSFMLTWNVSLEATIQKMNVASPHIRA